MKKNHKILLILILLLAGFLRFYRLGQIPYSLNWDEISHGYNAYSLLETGRDQWGAKWPIFNFRAYGDFPTTANLYLTMPFVKLLGLSAFSIRLPSAILGLAFVFGVFLFCRIFFQNVTLALFGAFLTAISPWAVFTSRAVFQSNLSQFFLVLAIYLFLRGLNKPLSFYLSAIFFGVSVYSYHNARIIVPIVIPILVYFYFPTLKKIYLTHKLHLILSTLILTALVLPNTINLFSPESSARSRWVGIINPNSINLINEKRRLFNGPEILNLALNNKPVYFTQSLIVNYLDLLNPIPIFFQASQDYQFNPPNTGLIYLIFLPFFYLGLFKIVIKSKTELRYLLFIILFIITLLPAALTSGDYPSIRATTALPFYFSIIAYGLVLIKKKIIIILVLIISLFELGNYSYNYLNYNLKYSFAWQYGYQQAVQYAKSNYTKYQQIAITKKYGEPHEFVLFYWPWNPQKYLSDSNKKTDFHSDWYWVDAFDKFIFINDWEINSRQFNKNTLLITSPGNYPKNKATLLKSIKFLDGSTAFDIVKYD